MVLGNLFINIGQCGNQVGRSFLTCLNDYEIKHSNSVGGSQYFSNSFCNTILIDTEPKVIQNILKNTTSTFKIDKDQCFYFQYGRGNNWAMSYSTFKQFDDLDGHYKHINYKQRTLANHGILEENSAIIDASIEKARRFLERLDYFRNFNIIFGIAGGTGSGLSSKLLETQKENFNDCKINSFVVFPDLNGELPLQYYNSILTLQRLQNNSDSIIYFNNGKVLKYLSDSLKQIQNGNLVIKRTNQPKNPTTDKFDIDKSKTVSFDQMNDYIGNCLSDQITYKSDCKSVDFNDQLYENQIFPGCKFQELFGESRSTDPKINPDKRPSLGKILTNLQETLGETHATNYPEQLSSHCNRTLSCTQLYKPYSSEGVPEEVGKSEATINKYMKNHLKPIEMYENSSTDTWLRLRKFPLINKDKTEKLLVFGNFTRIGNIVERITVTAKEKYMHRAYVHWYKKFGIHEDSFEDAFESCWNIVDNYNYVY